MLKEPYELLYEKEQNRYYLLNVAGIDQVFLGFESVEKMAVEMTYRKLFKKVTKTHAEELLQSLKLLPVNSGLLWLIGNAYNLPIDHVSDKGGLEKETFYCIWDELDVKDVRDAYVAMLTEAKSLNNWEFPQTVKNGVVKALIKENYDFFGLQKHGSYVRHYWLFKTTKLGNLNLLLVKEIGTTEPVTVSFEHFLFDKGAMKAIIDKFEGSGNIEDIDKNEEEK